MKLNLKAPIYEDHLSPTGFLPREEQIYASAAWHFARLAMPVLIDVPEQATPEGEKDVTVHLKGLLYATVTLYAIKDVNRLMNFMNFVKAEALRVGYPWRHEFDAFLRSGGRSFDEVTRNPDRLNLS